MKINNISSVRILFTIFLMVLSQHVPAQSDSLTGNGGGIIAFTSDRDGQNEIYFMNADGSSQTRITNTASEEYFPKWSPDGLKISYRKEGGIYIINIINLLNGIVSDPQLVINLGGASHEWTPDGKIIFDSPTSGNWDIYIVNANGDSLINITNSPNSVFDPDVSPDGTKIAFVQGFNLWVMDINGTNPQQITNEPMDFAPSWSPDGSEIAFISENGAQNLEIAIVNANGTNKRWVTNSPWLDEFPSWSPDGTKITYECDLNNLEKVFTVDVGGTNPTQLTNTNYHDGGPDWRPVLEPNSIDNKNSPAVVTDEFILYQNYPNPFNPNTTISYSIPLESFVTVKIYSVLGREIATLVNESLTAGNYEVDFNAADSPSGIYLYKIQAGDFINTKKMVLMK